MHVLVAIDLFDLSHQNLLSDAIGWAERLGATLDVGYVDGMSYVRPAILDRRLREILDVEMVRLKKTRKEQLSKLMLEIPDSVRGVARYCYDYPAVDAFIALTEGYDLVIVGTHGRTGMSRLILGSFAERVVRESPVPTLVLRTREPESDQSSS